MSRFFKGKNDDEKSEDDLQSSEVCRKASENRLVNGYEC